MSRGLNHQEPPWHHACDNTADDLLASQLLQLACCTPALFLPRDPASEGERPPPRGTYLISPSHGHQRRRIAGMWLECFARRCLEVYICGYTCSHSARHDLSWAAAAPMPKVQLASRAIVPRIRLLPARSGTPVAQAGHRGGNMGLLVRQMDNRMTLAVSQHSLNAICGDSLMIAPLPWRRELGKMSREATPLKPVRYHNHSHRHAALVLKEHSSARHLCPPTNGQHKNPANLGVTFQGPARHPPFRSSGSDTLMDSALAQRCRRPSASGPETRCTGASNATSATRHVQYDRHVKRCQTATMGVL
ncbi:hypothetical protein BKA63DRAFT_489340 [Paraphoma chrysanthemicola]|nr:hypothetical protein BKA63DRAFT_489340 [Paraphoma chrysanthemicola]